MARMSERSVVLITGASAGIGKATAAHLLRGGHVVYGAARRTERMSELQPSGLRALKIDVTDERSMVDGVERVLREQGRIDVLFNNAGFGLYGSIEEVAIAEARKQFEVNLFGLARLTQLVIPTMRAQGSGMIINNSSIGGKLYSPLGGWYYATKHALEGWSDCLRIELRQFGIRVVVIEPGLIETEFGRVSNPRLRAISGGGLYRDLVGSVTSQHAAATRRSTRTSQPLIIARAVSRAMRSRRPKTRYAAGRFAKPLLFARRCLSDRGYDRLMFFALSRR